MQKVLLLGDSISMGYREYVKEDLESFYEVVYPYENGKFAAHIYRMLYEWSTELSIDADNVVLVYWNCGLWDVVRIFQEEPQTPLTIYEEYLKRTYKRLKMLFPKAKICFAATTPVVEKRYGNNFYRLNIDIREYNNAAKAILKEVDMFDDLYEVVERLHVTEELYTDATHFETEISRFLAGHISSKILELISTDIKGKDMTMESMECVAKKIVTENISIALWGAGKNFRGYHNFIQKYCNVRFVIDKNIEMKGQIVDGLLCEAPETIKNDKLTAVVVMIDNLSAKDEIFKYCKELGIEVCGYRELLNELYPVYEKEILSNVRFFDADPDEKSEMKKYIGINVPAYGCNFACTYCYIDKKVKGKDAFPKMVHLPDYVRYRLSREKLGGCALIGICGYGETLLADRITDVCASLLKEGHYIHIVTNGVITSKIQEVLEKAGEYRKHIIFKISFHYLELKNSNLLEQFAENVKMIENSEASYSLELMPHDELIEYIPEILAFSLKKFGAYPQLTIGRDEHNNRKLLTNCSIEEYKRIWSVFESNMFDTRMKFYMMHGKNCNAGKYAFFFDLYTGEIDRCLFADRVGNIYDDECEYNFERVGDYCPMDYCFNCHVYATLGLMPDVDAPTYLDIRDRITVDGRHWIKDDMRRFLDIKLYETNKK